MRTIVIFLSIFFSAALYSQGSLQLSEYEMTPTKGIIYFDEFSILPKIQSNGYALGFNRGHIKKYYLTQYYHLEISYIKDLKQRSKSRYLQGFNGISYFTFGKQNELFMIKGGVGRKIYLSEKSIKRGVAMGYTYEGGINMASLKPYYLVLEYADELDQIFRTESYSDENASLFLDENKIRNKGSFFKGFDELQFIPGIYASSSLHFSFGAYDQYVKALDVGIQLDIFLKKLPIMVETDLHKNTFLFPSFFIHFQFGKRWR